MSGVLLWCSMLCAAEAPLQPVTVCEVLKDLNAYDGKVVLVVGRFSFRKTGRWLSEETCEQKVAKPEAADGLTLRLAYDPKGAPKLSPVVEIDAVALRQKVKVVRLRTNLHEFRFGSADYDRWAAVYGRVEMRPDLTRTSANEETTKAGGDAGRVPPQLLYSGDGVIVFLDNVQ